MSTNNLSADEIQTTLMKSITSMQMSFEEQRKEFLAKIDKLERIIEAKTKEIENLSSKSKNKHNSSDLQEQLETMQKMNAHFQEDIKQKAMEINNLGNEIKQLKDEKEVLKETQTKLENDLKNETLKYTELKNNYDRVESQFILTQKIQEKNKVEINKLKEEVEEQKKIILEKDEAISKLHKNNDEFLIYVNKIKEEEEKKRNDEIQLRLEKEKELQNEIKKQEMDNKNEMDKIFKENETQAINLEEKNKFLTDILCEFLLKLNNSQYFISVFDLLDSCLKHYDELKFFNKAETLYGNNLNDILYNFFGSFSSYVNIAGDNISLNDFLTQKSFKFSEIDKNDIEIIKRISSIKLSKDISILDLYRKKKEIFMKSVKLTFDLLKEKIINDDENKKKNFLNDKPDFLKINKPPTELEINFNEINIFKFGELVNYQIYNILPKLDKLKIYTSEAYLILLYSIIVHCPNLKSLNIILTSDSFNSGNNSVEIFEDIVPMLFTYLRKLTDFGYVNIPLSNKKLPSIVNSIKNSSLEKLTFSNCFNSKEDLLLFNVYFSNPNNLTEINLSCHDFNIPTLLSNSLLNYSINKQLLSIDFNSCNLNDEDVQKIANYITLSPIIKSVNIGKNSLSTLSCSTFAYSLQKTKSLEILIMNQCNINGETLLFLFNKKGSKSLKHINISNNDIGDIGLVSISAFIKNSPKLEIFELKNCGGGDMGFKSIINTIHMNENSKIKMVKFEKNNVSMEMIEEMKKRDLIFKAKGVMFTLDKTEEDIHIDCVKFVK